MDTRQHPDIFTSKQAIDYLRLADDEHSADPDRTLETLRQNHGLRGVRVGRSFLYHRSDLDGLVDRLFPPVPALKLTPHPNGLLGGGRRAKVV